ncbi:hypothetical protein DOTSEDRAFT_28406 [Dothistroma septosporum NZE10]|uniref:Uncharacterized protein n=1 Tax=Dothistroma septosporum (strain NZE10 / CBS 128990) TaxID=675120 RepID=M2YJW7_DOTSN|nr:hypothetical protein DOTSEDRAFT_28406 [Dothistroma septosporum NZE10]
MSATLGADPSNNHWQKKVYSENVDYHWTLDDTTHTLDSVDPLGLKEALEAQSAGTSGPLSFQQKRAVRVATYPKGSIVRIRMSQDKDIIFEEQRHPASAARKATHAVYETMFNTVDGVIVLDQALGPKTMIEQRGRPRPGHMPAKSNWSDAIW